MWRFSVFSIFTRNLYLQYKKMQYWRRFAWDSKIANEYAGKKSKKKKLPEARTLKVPIESASFTKIWRVWSARHCQRIQDEADSHASEKRQSHISQNLGPLLARVKKTLRCEMSLILLSISLPRSHLEQTWFGTGKWRSLMQRKDKGWHQGPLILFLVVKHSQ